MFDYGNKLPDGQHERHPFAEDADKEYVEPGTDRYRHNGCGTVTRMPYKQMQTIQRHPKFYSRTFCCGCRDYFPISEFVWTHSEIELGVE